MKSTLGKVVLITTAVAVVSLGIAVILFFTTNMNGTWEMKGGIIVDEGETIALEGINKIDIRTGSIDVAVSKHQGSGAEVQLRGTVYHHRPEALPVLTVEQTGDSLEITTEQKKGGHFFHGFHSGDLVLEIRVPEQYRHLLAVHTGSGDVDIVDQDLAELSVDTGSGDICLRSVRAAAVSLESSSGDQEADELQAEYVELTSASGDLRAGGLQGGARVRSASGEITLSYLEFDADLEARSGSGDVRLFLTGTAQFRLDARSSSGDISCEFPLTLTGPDSEMSRKTLIGTVGDGARRVAVKTSSGDIQIRY